VVRCSSVCRNTPPTNSPYRRSRRGESGSVVDGTAARPSLRRAHEEATVAVDKVGAARVFKSVGVGSFAQGRDRPDPRRVATRHKRRRHPRCAIAALVGALRTTHRDTARERPVDELSFELVAWQRCHIVRIRVAQTNRCRLPTHGALELGGRHARVGGDGRVFFVIDNQHGIVDPLGVVQTKQRPDGHHRPSIATRIWQSWLLEELDGCRRIVDRPRPKPCR
jgi:hypothetical protein